MADSSREGRYRGGLTDDPQIKDLHDHFDYATDAWADIRTDARENMRYVSGHHWAPHDLKLREDSGRPALSLDELGQYVNQIVNDIRQNKRAIKVTPLGNGANDQTAALRADLFRQIEYRSNAQQAYTVMFENAVQRSYGYLRAKAKYVTHRSRHQELLIDPIMNPDLVTPDPDAIRPDLADMKFLFLEESWNKKEFKKAFPKAKFQDFTTDMMNAAPRWVKDERIMLAEWWKIATVKKKLLYYDVPGIQQPGQPPQPPQELELFEGEPPPPGGVVVGERMADAPKVTMCLTNGLEILEETDWPGRYIPFVGCFGKILYLTDGGGPTKQILSAITLARPAQMGYDYYRTGSIEQAGMATRFPYFVRKGSLSPEEAVKLTKSTHEPVAFIEINGVSDQMPPGALPEMPVRNPFEPALQAFEIGAESMRRSIQAAMGISPLPTSAQRRNEKSGVALKQIEESAQKGTFHFVDHFEDAITRTAVILDDLIPHYYDAARDLTVRKADDTAIQVRVNDPNRPLQGDQADAYGPTPSPKDGDHDMTLSTGPNFESEREAANDFADTLVGNIQPIAQVAGPQAAAKIMALGIKLKNIGPLGAEMADIISPPEDGQPNPQQVMAQNEQLKQAVQQLQQLADDNQTKVAIAKGNAATDLQKTQIQEAADSDRNRENNEVKLAVAELTAKVERMALFYEERARVGAEGHEVGRTMMEHEHAKELTGMQHQQALEAGAQGHQQALEQGEAAHAQGLEAAQVPPPLDPNRAVGAE